MRERELEARPRPEPPEHAEDEKAEVQKRLEGLVYVE
jgi:hypothetical protein